MFTDDSGLDLKQNQPALHAKVKALLDEAILDGFAGMSHGHVERTDDAHGRVETRRTWVTDEVNWLGDDLLARWPGLASLAVIESVRQDLGDLTGKVTTERRYYVSSHKGTDAQAMNDAVRGHWSVENQLHWQLDVSFREDECRVRTDHAPANLSVIRRFALGLLKRETSCRRGIETKRLKCAASDEYREKALFNT